MKIKFCFFCASLLAPISFVDASESAWNLDDVTYILPLPTQALLAGSIRASDLNHEGRTVLPVEVLKSAANVTSDNFLTSGDLIPHSNDFSDYGNLFLVSLRIDPCFKDQFEDSCRRQIRAVWQPVDHWKDGTPQALDAAVHTFFDLSASDFSKLLTSLKQIKEKNGISTEGLPLGVHPGFSATQLTPFQSQIRDTFLEYLTSARLSRVAVMSIVFESDNWKFISTNISEGNFTPLRIFNVQDRIQSFENGSEVANLSPDQIENIISSRQLYTSASQTFALEANDFRPDVGDQILVSVLGNIKSAIDTPEKAKLVLQKVQRVENPLKNLPGTVDCISCHAAGAAKLFISSTMPDLQLDIPTIMGKYNLMNNSPYRGSSHQFRMLGYIFDKVQASDRSIYETALVADQLNRIQPDRSQKE